MKGKPFGILKFRTMHGDSERGDSAGDRVTSLGRFLRWTKLDELPQLLNVLRGEMSLVGPRPRTPDQTTIAFPCRPGLTGAATLAFTQESALLEGVPRERVSDFYRDVLLPLKVSMDRDYLAEATFLSDLRILAATATKLFWRAQSGQYGAAAQVQLLAQGSNHVSADPEPIFPTQRAEDGARAYF